MAVELVGVDTVLSNLNKEILKIHGRTAVGMRAAAEKIKGNSMALTPVDTSALRASHFVNVDTSPTGIVATVGATQFYAIFVHENLEARHPVGQAKFLETAIKEAIPTILRLIAKFAKI